MFYCLLWHASCFILFLACFSLNLCSFMLVHMFFCPDLRACALCYMFMPRYIISMCCLARSTCFYACLHAYMFRSTCLGFYAVLSSFRFILMLGLCAHMLDIILWLCFARIYVFVCFSPYFMLRSTSVHTYVLGFMFFHVYVLAFTCSHMLPCLYV